MENLVEYEENYIPGIAVGIGNIDNNLTFGNGQSYGLELFFSKSSNDGILTTLIFKFL